MSLHVAVCDDEVQVGFQLEEYLEKICAELNIAVETDVYYSGESLCEKLVAGECYDLIFLDIEMANINGIQAGTKVRDEYHDETTQIVYISGKPQYALELFDTNPLNFLIKPLGYEDIKKVINRLLKISGLWSDTLTYKVGHDTFRIKLSDIMYFQSIGRKIKIFLKNGEDEMYGSLEELYSVHLKKHGYFLFIHKSYIVNYNYVSVFEYKNVILFNKTALPIGQSKRKEIRLLQKKL